MTMIAMNLVTLKAGAKFEHFFNKPDSESNQIEGIVCEDFDSLNFTSF
jgi:hypothetical protein